MDPMAGTGIESRFENANFTYYHISLFHVIRIENIIMVHTIVIIYVYF